MSSLLNNNNSMVALTTLRSINNNLSQVQSEISTGKSVATARDNASIWAVSKVMESDVDSFDAISSSLDLGASTVAVARGAAEQITGLLQEMKGLIVAAQEDNVDRGKIQTDVDALVDQVDAISKAAQFNGLNLLSGNDDVTVLSSLDRAADGTVTASSITVARNDLTVTGGTADPATGTITLTDATIEAESGGTNGEGTITIGGTITEGEVFTATFGGNDYSYTAANGDDANAVATGLAAAYTGSADAVANVTAAASTNTVVFTNTDSGTGPFTITQSVTGVGGSGLAGLSSIDVSTDSGAATALNDIEGLIQTSIDAAAAFGSSQKRIDIQSEFVTTLTDSMKSGISALTDADMEEASARLQSLQVQQQLGIQALSIANQSPQSLLSLFQ